MQAVSITRLSASSVQVSWEPFITEANVTGYTVIYSRVSGSSKRQDGEIRSVFPATTNSGVIDGLEPEGTYAFVFQVLASAVVEGEEVVGDRSLLTEDSLVLTQGLLLLPPSSSSSSFSSFSSFFVIVLHLFIFLLSLLLLLHNFLSCIYIYTGYVNSFYVQMVVLLMIVQMTLPQVLLVLLLQQCLASLWV